MKAATAAFRRYPLFNSSLDDAAQEVVVHKHVHMGFAAATDNGLMVPVIRHAEHKSLLDLAKAIVDLAERTRGGKATLEELTGSTFTISNVGLIGGIRHADYQLPGGRDPLADKIEQRPVVPMGRLWCAT